MAAAAARNLLLVISLGGFGSAQWLSGWSGTEGYDSETTTAVSTAELPGWVSDARTICRDMAQTKNMYTEAPYPPRDPTAELAEDTVAVDSKITPAAIAHHIHGGRFPATEPGDPYRVLVAGGGTGDATLKYATYFANIGISAEIVHMDLSASSLSTAEARVRAHMLHTYQGLTMRFIQGNLSQIGTAESPLRGSYVGKDDDAEPAFDFIESRGVLHHLPSPEDGLKRLASVLKPTGGMLLMLYGDLGRTGIYHFHEMVRLLEGGGYGRAPASARRLLDVLPPSNWLSRNKQIQKGDLQHFGDSGVWDLLLHHCDRSYRVPDLVRLTHAAGLKVLSFANPNAYELPDTLATVDTPKDSAADSELDSLRQAAAELEPLAQASLAELMHGNIGKHVFYVAKAAASTQPLSLIQGLRDLGRTATLKRRRHHNQRRSPLLTMDQAADLVPCHVGNFHGQAWVFGQAVSTALRKANEQSIAQTRKYSSKRIAQTDGELELDDQEKLLVARPTFNFRDPLLRAHVNVPAVAVELMRGTNCVSTLRMIHTEYVRGTDGETWSLPEFIAEVGDFYATVDRRTALDEAALGSHTLFTVLDRPFRGLVDRKARKTYGTGATWVDVEIEDVWVSPPVEKQVPPIAFDQQIGKWLKEHAVQTHLFVFARADELAPNAQLRQVLERVGPKLLDHGSPMLLIMVDFDANRELATLFHVNGTTLPSMRIAAAELHETVPAGAPDGTKPMTSRFTVPFLPAGPMQEAYRADTDVGLLAFAKAHRNGWTSRKPFPNAPHE